MNVSQEALTFRCGDDWLVGIVARPGRLRSRGVLILVGGPQYRAGSHRQFVLLAERLAEQGTPVMRFDYRGMGDSTGRQGEIEDWVVDLGFAMDAFFAAVDGLREVVIWGLCEGASAAALYAHHDVRVSGVVLLNPWVRTLEGEARTYLRHYYFERLLSPELWRKVLRGDFELRRSSASLLQYVRRAIPERVTQGSVSAAVMDGRAAVPLPERMADGLLRFKGAILVILSGKDLTAKEFIDVTRTSRPWRQLLARPRVTRHLLEDATHTFSRHDWREQVETWTSSWVQSW
jgi:uncharacterized protein